MTAPDSRLGPFYASAGTGRGGCASLFGLLTGLLILGVIVAWPLMTSHAKHGYHLWAWFIAIPWWILLAGLGIAYLASQNGSRKPRQPKSRK